MASMSPREKRAERKERNKTGLDMNLVSLIDIFTILIFFLMSSAAGVEILSPAGKVLDTMNLGAQRTGMHSFDWPAGTFDDTARLTFRVTASSGANQLTSTALMRDKVTAVSTSGNDLVLELESGASVAYTSVKAIN